MVSRGEERRRITFETKQDEALTMNCWIDISTIHPHRLFYVLIGSPSPLACNGRRPVAVWFIAPRTRRLSVSLLPSHDFGASRALKMQNNILCRSRYRRAVVKMDTPLAIQLDSQLYA